MLSKEIIGPIAELTRRDFLTGVILLILAAIFGEAWYLKWLWDVEVKKIRDDWNEALSYASAEEFIKKNKNWLSHIRLGFNISPETLEWVYRDSRPDYYGAPLPTPAETVQTLIEEYGLTTGRIGLRMDRCIDVNNDFNIHLDYYKPWLDELAKQKKKQEKEKKKKIDYYICLGVKVFRWPEMHIPPELLTKLYGEDIPDKGHVIKPEDPLGQYMLTTYYPRLCEALLQLAKDAEYPEDFFYCMQPENEPLTDFGKLGWKVSKEFLLQAIGIVHRYFPKSKIMENSPIVGGTLRDINEVLLEAQQLYPELEGNIFTGLNNYFEQPHPKLLTMQAGDVEFYENWALANVTKQFTGDPREEIKKLRAEEGKAMGSEIPMEGWPPYNLPGNDVHRYFFILERYKGILELPKRGKIDMHNWGNEEQMFNLGNKNHPHRWHHLEIVKIMKGVNKL